MKQALGRLDWVFMQMPKPRRNLPVAPEIGEDGRQRALAKCKRRHFREADCLGVSVISVPLLLLGPTFWTGFL